MPRPKREIAAMAAETETPPSELPTEHAIAIVRTAAGNNLFRVALPKAPGDFLAELATRFRSTIWIRRGSYVVVARGVGDSHPEIVNVVRDERAWRRMHYWPAAFAAPRPRTEEDEEDEGPRMPPSDSEPEDNAEESAGAASAGR